MNDDLHRMAAVGDLAGAFEGASADNALGQARNAFDGAEVILARFRDAATEADGSRHLTDISANSLGSARPRRRHSSSWAASRSDLCGTRSSSWASSRGELGVDPVGRDDAVGELRAQEVRRHLLSLDELEREILLAEAIELGDETTLAAFFGAPSIFKIVSREKLDAARQAWAEKRHPAKARESDQLRRAVDAAAEMIEMARDEVTQAAGLLDDKVPSMAAGRKEPARVG